MAALPTSVLKRPEALVKAGSPFPHNPSKKLQHFEFSGVFRGRELTRKTRRLGSGLLQLDALLGGGIARGRISEIIGQPGSGRTTIAACFAASATSRGEVVAWMDSTGAFDPSSMAKAGVDLARVLWASFAEGCPPLASPVLRSSDVPPSFRPKERRFESCLLKAAELVLEAGGFALVVVDFGRTRYPLLQSAALRIARSAERSNAAVLMLAPRRMCGSFAALSLTLSRSQARFSRLSSDSPPLFDGLEFQARIACNKLGAIGGQAVLNATLDTHPRREGEAPTRSVMSATNRSRWSTGLQPSPHPGQRETGARMARRAIPT